MSRHRIAAALLLLSAFVPAVVKADNAAPAMSPGAAFKADLLGNAHYVEGEITELAGAIPADKWNWRPAAGVRSVSEVYMHIAGGCYLLASFLGTPWPADVPQDLEKVTDKAKVLDALKKAFAHLDAAVNKVPDADFDTKVKFFGNELSERSVMLIALSHLHEHLGQSIAYARTNGVVPPWTAREQAEAQKKAAEKKPGR